jgi:pimeloyl-ACP methyl ester carboxylesterase
MGADTRKTMNSLLAGVLAFMLLGAAAPARAQTAQASKDYLVHMPGIAGYHWLDRQFLSGLRDAGFEGDIEVRDWPGDDPGLAALLARKRNRQEAQAVADMILARVREHPGGRIVLTAHSGGAGIAVWALEKLPDDVKVDTVLMLAPALSPRYDLSKALRHVRGNAYAFTSTFDAIVLGAGTSTFGTIDGVKCDAAGRCGFTVPDGADEKAYEKLVQVPYDAKWMQEGNIGDHIGPMGFRFTRSVLAPLVVGEEVAKDAKAPAVKTTSAAKGQASSSAARRNEGLASSRKKQSNTSKGATAP